MMYAYNDNLKPATTIADQISILKKRGLIISSEMNAKTLLSYVHYYRLSAYCIGLKCNNTFIPDITIEQIYRIYRFDEKFRRFLFTIIEPIEIKLRAAVANHLALKYGNICHKDSSIFNDIDMHRKFLDKHTKAVRQMKQCAFVIHNLLIYGDLPIWVAIETWSFGIVSKLFGNLKPEDRKAIARCFDIDKEYFTSWLECLCYLRNICAHNDRIYNRLIVKRPKLYKSDSQYNCDKIFPCLLMVKRIYHNRGSSWRQFTNDLKSLVSEYCNDINLSFIGFPADWYRLLISDFDQL